MLKEFVLEELDDINLNNGRIITEQCEQTEHLEKQKTVWGKST